MLKTNSEKDISMKITQLPLNGGFYVFRFGSSSSDAGTFAVKQIDVKRFTV